MSSAPGPRPVGELSVRGKRVFLRADLNVPLRQDPQSGSRRGGAIADDTRIRASMQTLDHLRAAGARVLLASHLGRPKGERREEFSLRPVAEHLGVELAPDCVGEAVEARANSLADGEVLLLENLRFHAGEEENDAAFVAQLARLCDVYVNDAFGAAHRAHASTAGLARATDDRAAGFLLAREIEALTRVRDAAESPYVCILGGAKVSDKLAVLEALSRRADTIVIGGAMAYTFLLARGESVGKSLVEPDLVDTAKKLLDGSAEILLPSDHAVAPRFDAPDEMKIVEQIPDGHLALDVGPASVAAIGAHIDAAKTVFWNGPLGLFETPPFDRGTRAVAERLAASSAYSVVGGGDSLAAVQVSGVGDRISHLSTGGGASLEFLEGKELPGITALEASR